jgi:hypothetical protein
MPGVPDLAGDGGASMDHLRIAAVQLEYQPVTRLAAGFLRLDEPLVSLDPLVDHTDSENLLGSLKNQRSLRSLAESAMAESRQKYIENMTEKIRDIMTFLVREGTNVVVFPEYSIPSQVLRRLHEFSNAMTIVAGIGYLRSADVPVIEGLGIEVPESVQGCNVAVVLSPIRNFLVTKKNRAESESMEDGQGPGSGTIRVPGREVPFTVAICLDFLNEKAEIDSQSPEIVAIPALTRSIQEFATLPPRNYARIFANHSNFGGTYIGAPSIKGLSFVDRNGTRPLPAGVEGIVIVDWDYKNPFPVKPSSTITTDHRLVGRSSFIYKGRDEELAKGAERLDSITKEEIRAQDLFRAASEIVSLIDQAGDRMAHRYQLLGNAASILADQEMDLLLDEVRLLSRHCVLSRNVLSAREWKYLRCVSVHDQLKSLMDNVPVYQAMNAYDAAAREIAPEVRTTLLAARHRGPVSPPGGASGGAQLIFYARLGPYDQEETAQSLPRQLTLLRAIADLNDPNLILRYRLQTGRDKDGIMRASYHIACVTRGRMPAEIEDLREGLGQLIHIAFAGAYSISYTTIEVEQEEAVLDLTQLANYWVEIRRRSSADGTRFEYRGMPDWALIADFLRSLDDVTYVELQISMAAPESQTTEGPGAEEADDLSHAEVGGVEGETASQVLSRLLRQEARDPRRLRVRILVGSERPLPAALAESVGAELAGGSPFAITGSESSGELESEYQRDTDPGLSPVEALRVFHPPFGRMFYTTGHRRPDLDLMTQEPRFPATGIYIGKARIRQVRSDEQIDVRLLSVDRLRHAYVIGKTGTGKSNLLKIMASQDVRTPDRGVTIIDPHGDLVDHVIREIPDHRLSEVVLIDLARADALPVLNPLDVDRTDTTLRDRTIQELIVLLHSRVYHEFTGPRFDELVRLAFRTMLDEGYPLSASFVEVPRLFMDREFQTAVVAQLQDEELKSRWAFEAELARDPEYGSLVHWVTSKFEDFARDSILRRVLGGGKATVQIERIVLDNGILLVRIPEAVIGSQAADFVGSLILTQLKMAIVRRRQFGDADRYHFVYVDEFQNFANTDFHTLVAEARKFNIGFTLAHQNLEQLREFRTFTGAHEQRLVNAIVGNVANTIVFSVGTFDAATLSRHLDVSERDILRIGRYQALAKILVEGHDTAAFTLHVDEAVQRDSPRNVETIERNMRRSYWLKLKDVTADIAERNSIISSLKAQGAEPLRDLGEDRHPPQRHAPLEPTVERSERLVFSLPYWEESIEKVSYFIKDEKMHIVVSPAGRKLRFDDRDVRIATGHDLPTLNARRLRALRARAGDEVARYVISIPYLEGTVDRVSYEIAANYLHVILRGEIGRVPIDRSAVKFERYATSQAIDRDDV